MLKLMLITNNRRHAATACACGVDRIFVDLETLGKRERQRHRDTLISDHTIQDVAAMRAVVPDGHLLVRTNPLHADSQLEIDAAIEAGTSLLMLPMFTSAAEVASYCDIVRGRVPVIPLIETLGAVKAVDDLVKLGNVAELYVGLNDLHLDLGLNFIFDVLLLDIVDRVAAASASAVSPA
jgi:citrate lyase beta subunit